MADIADFSDAMTAAPAAPQVAPEHWRGMLSVYRYFVSAYWEAEAADRMSDEDRRRSADARRTAGEIRRIATWRAKIEGVDLSEAFDRVDQEERIL